MFPLLLVFVQLVFFSFFFLLAGLGLNGFISYNLKLHASRFLPEFYFLSLFEYCCSRGQEISVIKEHSFPRELLIVNYLVTS